MIKYKSLAKNIPHRIKIGTTEYEVLYVDDFKDGATAGETRWDPPQIIIKNGMSAKETVHTAFHEFIHAVSAEYDVNLTESQVEALEQSFTVMKKFFSNLEGK